MRTIKITYWVSTVVVSLLLLMGGLQMLMQTEQMIESVSHVSFPAYVMPFLGTFKLLGMIALLVPKLPRVKEWAYAGITFLLIGASWAHFSSGDGIEKTIIPLFALAILAISYFAFHKIKHTFSAGVPKMSVIAAEA